MSDAIIKITDKDSQKTYTVFSEKELGIWLIEYIKPYMSMRMHEMGEDSSAIEDVNKMVSEISDVYKYIKNKNFLALAGLASHYGIEVKLEEVPMVTISQKEFIEMSIAYHKLSVLETDGVDNWTWYMESQEEYIKEMLGDVYDFNNDNSFHDIAIKELNDPVSAHDYFLAIHNQSDQTLKLNASDLILVDQQYHEYAAVIEPEFLSPIPAQQKQWIKVSFHYPASIQADVIKIK